jgi:hypothetical protein
MREIFKSKTEAISYGLPITYGFNLLQSIFFAILFYNYIDSEYANFLYLNNEEGNALDDSSSDDYREKVKELNSNVIVSIFLFALLYSLGKKMYVKCCDFCFFSIILSIILLIFKIVFVPFAIGLLNVEIFKYTVHNSCYFYWNIGTALFYLTLIISCFLMKDIKSLFNYYCLIALIWSAIFFLIEYLIYKDLKSAGVCAGLILTEEVFEIGSVFYAEKQNFLSEQKKMENVVVIDDFKYFIVMVIIAILMYLMLMLIVCFITCICHTENDYKYYKDQYGNIYVFKT